MVGMHQDGATSRAGVVDRVRAGDQDRGCADCVSRAGSLDELQRDAHAICASGDHLTLSFRDVALRDGFDSAPATLSRAVRECLCKFDRRGLAMRHESGQQKRTNGQFCTEWYSFSSCGIVTAVGADHPVFPTPSATDDLTALVAPFWGCFCVPSMIVSSERNAAFAKVTTIWPLPSGCRSGCPILYRLRLRTGARCEWRYHTARRSLRLRPGNRDSIGSCGAATTERQHRNFKG